MQGVCAANPVCADIVPFFGPSITVPRDRNDSELENFAVYGMVEYDFSDAWGLTVEARYQEEDISRTATVQ